MKERPSILDQLKHNLKDYLKQHDREPKGRENVRCVNSEVHTHGDRHPSASILDRDTYPVLYCHGCKRIYDIFDCAHFLEGKPLEGKGFWEDNVVYLANMFGAQIDKDEVSEDQKEMFIKLRAYKHAAHFIVKGYAKDGPVVEMLEARGIKPKIAEKMLIGGIESYEAYINYMLEMGWSEPALASFGLTRKDIINPRNLVFCVANESGNTVGFVGRDTTWTKESTNAKYVNSSNSDIYQKGHILYNMNLAKEFSPGPVYIVEGYVDTVTLYANGVTNVVSVGSTSFTNEHVRLLNDLGFKRLWFAYDSDQGGKDGIERALSRVSAYNIFDEVRVVSLPSGHDPDSYINAFGCDAFTSLEKQTPFEWTLDNMTYDADPEVVCNQAMRLIINEQNLITRESMIKSLSRKTGVNTDAIKGEMGRILKDKESQKTSEIKTITDDLLLKLRTMREGESAKEIVRGAFEKIEATERNYDSNVDIATEYKSFIRIIQDKCKEEKRIDGVPLTRFKRFEENLQGYPDHGCLMTLGGKPGTGKTSLLRNIAWDLVCTNEKMISIYMSIDDSRNRMLPAIVGMDQLIPIKYVKNFAQISDPEMAARWHEGWRKLDAYSDRFIVRDASHGTTLDILERYINYIMEKFPDKKPSVILDNFHLLTDYNNLGTREQNVNRSKRIKNISTSYDIPIIQTVELRKLDNTNRPPTMEDILETGQISYDSDVIMMLHNDLHINKDTSIKWNWVDTETGETRSMPYLELSFEKNIEGDYQGNMNFKFIKHMTYAEETDEAVREGASVRRPKIDRTYDDPTGMKMHDW